MCSQRRDDDVEIRIPRLARDTGPSAVHPEVSRATSTPTSTPTEGGYGTPDTRDWFFFALELRTALEAGVSFVQAITLVIENTRSRTIRRSLHTLLVQLREGQPVADILAKCREIPPLIRNLMIVGIRGGNTAQALKQITDHYDWLLEMRGRILRVITYPAALLILGAAIMVFRDTTIASLKHTMDTTNAAMHFSIRYFLPIISGAGAAIIIAWLVYTPLIRPVFDKIVLTAPLVGKMIQSYAIAVFYRVLAVLIESGMPITNAWMLALQSTTNRQVGRKLQAGLHYLQDGESLDEALRQTHIIPKEARAMAATGAISGNIPTFLNRYSNYSEKEIKSLFRGLTAVIGPVCLIFVTLGYFVNPIWLGALAFFLMLARRLV